MLLLGIETSCDETAAGVLKDRRTLLSNVILSQVVHQPYGGVVPELASREHMRNLVPIVDQALAEAKTPLEKIEGLAVTFGPGLVGALLVGISFAKAVAVSRRLPIIGVNHLEGHIFSNALEHPELEPPFVCLVVSGGHTLLVLVKNWGVYRLLGQTRDDAAGEAFDKVAKLLGAGYPGGQKIDDLAQTGNPARITFPRAYLEKEAYDFSFSGLKTAVALYVQKLSERERENLLPHLCAGFQEAVVDVLVAKTVRAAEESNVSAIAVAGGVARNRRLRQRLGDEASRRGMKFFVPVPQFCTDNAAMIAAAGAFHLSRGERSDLSLNAAPYVPLNGVA